MSTLEKGNLNPLVTFPNAGNISSGKEARQLYRKGLLKPYTHTTGMAPGYMQGSPVIIPKSIAHDFLTLCQRNPKPCPLIAIGNVGEVGVPSLGEDIDLRTDTGGYRIWRNGELVEEVSDLSSHWRDDFVAFVIGCSYSFEEALLSANLELRHHTMGVTVPMYRTNIPLVSSGSFSGYVCVSMRPFSPKDAIRAIEITARFPLTHGTPIHFGDPSAIGIEDINAPLVGDAVEVNEGEVPVFWGCGITPQYTLLEAKPEFAITHKPGCLLISDVLSTGDATNISIE